MAGIYYTANARAPLITDSPAHVAGAEYSIDVKLQQLVEAIETPKTQHVSIGGHVETVLKRASRLVDIALIWPDTENADIEEFLYSIAGGETFILDPYGTIAAPVQAQNYKCISNGFSISRMSHGSSPWRSVSLQLRPV